MPPRRVRAALRHGGRVARLALAAIMLYLFGASVLAGCSCGVDDVIARLAQIQGRVERDHAASMDQWLAAKAGAELRMGDGVRTLDGSTAQLTLGGGAQLDMTPRTVIRFLGWSVFVDSEPVVVDTAMRFSARAVVPRGGRALAIQFRHPQRGIHYYLRRPAGVR